MAGQTSESKWLEITVHTTPEHLDGVIARLAAAGMDAISIEDEADFRRFLEENRQYWGQVEPSLIERMKGAARVKFYVPDSESGRAELAGYTSGLGCEYTVRSLAESDWAYGWQKYYHPLPVGKKLYIVPDWEKGSPVPEGRTPVYLDPGLSFGTGSHPSTQLCLEGLEDLVRPGSDILDLGCGSGILAIAALCLGAGTALAVDVDPKAADAARENAALNGIPAERFTACAGDVLTDRQLSARLGTYRLVLANIVADVIIPLSAAVPALLDRDGVFLCSGIIDSRADEVCAALARNGLTVTDRRERSGWAALTARLS